MSRSGILIVVSAPSGAGKGSVLRRVLEADPNLALATSATTRAPRGKERNGVEYLFITRDKFQQWIDDDRFLEWAEVHGHLYGTPKAELEEGLATGNDLVLELDVQGMRSVRGLYPDAVTVFIAPPSYEELERRLRGRGDVPNDEIPIRLANAKLEMAAQKEYDNVIVNQNLDESVAEFTEIVRRARAVATARQS